MPIADADRGIRHVFLRNMELQASIGVHPHEHQAAQRIRINVDLGVAEDPAEREDRLHRVVDYERLASTVRRIVGARHVNLVETLAEQLAASCLEDERVLLVRVRVEKLDVFADTEAAGVEVERRQRKSSTSTGDP